MKCHSSTEFQLLFLMKLRLKFTILQKQVHQVYDEEPNRLHIYWLVTSPFMSLLNIHNYYLYIQFENDSSHVSGKVEWV